MPYSFIGDLFTNSDPDHDPIKSIHSGKETDTGYVLLVFQLAVFNIKIFLMMAHGLLINLSETKN